jgi:hypothetical protein
MLFLMSFYSRKKLIIAVILVFKQAEGGKGGA